MGLPPLPTIRPVPEHPASLAWEPVIEDEQIVGLVCPDCLTARERRAIRHEQAGVVRRLKRGLRP